MEKQPQKGNFLATQESEKTIAGELTLDELMERANAEGKGYRQLAKELEAAQVKSAEKEKKESRLRTFGRKTLALLGIGVASLGLTSGAAGSKAEAPAPAPVERVVDAQGDDLFGGVQDMLAEAQNSIHEAQAAAEQKEKEAEWTVEFQSELEGKRYENNFGPAYTGEMNKDAVVADILDRAHKDPAFLAAMTASCGAIKQGDVDACTADYLANLDNRIDAYENLKKVLEDTNTDVSHYVSNETFNSTYFKGTFERTVAGKTVEGPAIGYSKNLKVPESAPDNQKYVVSFDNSELNLHMELRPDCGWQYNIVDEREMEGVPQVEHQLQQKQAPAPAEQTFSAPIEQGWTPVEATPKVRTTPSNPIDHVVYTPRTPEAVTPHTPSTPENPTTPVTPETPEVPTTPEQPVTPEVPTQPPVRPEVPEEPTPETPTEPETPVEPPVNPETPVEPETPTEPETPVEPEKPTPEPEKPVEPETPTPEPPKPPKVDESKDWSQSKPKPEGLNPDKVKVNTNENNRLTQDPEKEGNGTKSKNISNENKNLTVSPRQEVNIQAPKVEQSKPKTEKQKTEAKKDTPIYNELKEKYVKKDVEKNLEKNKAQVNETKQTQKRTETYKQNVKKQQETDAKAKQVEQQMKDKTEADRQFEQVRKDAAEREAKRQQAIREEAEKRRQQVQAERTKQLQQQREAEKKTERPQINAPSPTEVTQDK